MVMLLRPEFHEQIGWIWEPSIVYGLLAISAAYAFLCFRQAKNGRSASLWQQLAFHAGTLVVAIALLSPIDGLSDTDLFSVHMLQHVLITFVAPPLWLLGIRAEWMQVVKRFPRLGSIFAGLGNPVFAFLLFNGVMWAWHWPVAYDMALGNETIHIFEHLMFIATALIGWLPIFGHLLPEGKRLTRPLRGLYAVASIPPCTALAAIITFSGTQLYTFYGQRALEWGLSPMADQALGGLIMWMPTDIIFLTAALLLFNQWLSEKQMAPSELAFSYSK